MKTKKKKPKPVTAPPTDRGRKKATSWQPIFLVYIYRHAKAGLSDEAIARAMEINRNTIKVWKKNRGEVAKALELGRQETPEDGFTSYFYRQLPPRLQALWMKIETASTLGSGLTVINSILADHGKRARQSLFLHALVSSHFSPTRAMEKVGIDKRQLESWIESDPDFAELVEEVQYHKRAFCEEKLMELVSQGDRMAILFANKGLNRQAYGREQDVSVNINNTQNNYGALDLNELDLSLACRTEIANAIRQRDAQRERNRLLGQALPEERARLTLEARISESVPPIPEGEPRDN